MLEHVFHRQCRAAVRASRSGDLMDLALAARSPSSAERARASATRSRGCSRPKARRGDGRAQDRAAGRGRARASPRETGGTAFAIPADIRKAADLRAHRAARARAVRPHRRPGQQRRRAAARRARLVRRRRVGQGRRAEPDERRAAVASRDADDARERLAAASSTSRRSRRCSRSPRFGLSVATWAGVIGYAKTLSLEVAADRHHRQHDLPGPHRDRAARQGVRHAGTPAPRRRPRRAQHREADPDGARRHSPTRSPASSRSSCSPWGGVHHGRRAPRRRRPPREPAMTNEPDGADFHIPWYFRALDFEQLTRDYPPPPDYFHDASRCRATRCARCRKSASWRPWRAAGRSRSSSATGASAASSPATSAASTT